MNTDLTPAPTPRTDEAEASFKEFYRDNGMIKGTIVPSDFARGLERELLAAHKTAEELSGALREEQLKTQAAIKLLIRCLPIIESDAQMMADLTRFAPLPAADQARHDSTETDSERLAVELPLFLAGEQTTKP